MVLQALLGERGTVDEARAAQHMRAHDRGTVDAAQAAQHMRAHDCGTVDVAQEAQWGGTVMTHN